MSAVIPAPVLTEVEIRREVERVATRQHRSHLIALFGRGPAAAFEVAKRRYSVVPTRCELELRAALPEHDLPDDQGVVYLVDWTEGPLPLDISCRLARGRLGRITFDARLATVFGARACEPGLLGTRLAELVLAGEIPGLTKTTGQLLRAPEAYRRVMAAVLGFPLEEEFGPILVVKWAVVNDGGPAFVARGPVGAPWAGLREEIRQRVRETAGELAGVAWLAWEQGRGRRFVEVALVIDALRSQLGAGTYVEGLLRGRLEALAPGFGLQLLAEAGALSDDHVIESALGALSRDGGIRLGEMCRSAESLIDDPTFRDALSGSQWLPAGMAAAQSRLAQALARAVERTTPAAARSAAKSAEQALKAVEAHRLAGETAPDLVESRRHSVRLACYLATQSDRSGDQAPKGQEAVATLASMFVDEGGWVDLARLHLRSHREDGIAEATAKLLAAVDTLRRDQDRQFAAGVVDWLAAGRPATEVIPIEHAVRRLAVDFLQEKPVRKLLVVLMDGMSWANAVELVTSLGSEVGGWQPVAWRPKGFRSAQRGGLPPVIAAVPTLTALSRAAFFAGKLTPSSWNEPTAKDRERWAGNRSLSAVLDGQEPVLLLRDQVVTAGTRLHDEAARQITDGPRIVALVVNAIDEHLAGSAQIVSRFGVSDIKLLREILVRAAGADRAVLLASDHGHVPGDLLVDRKEAVDGGHRWRPLAAGESAAPYELALPAGTASVPKGASAVAVVWDERVCYGQPSLGEHGGITLAEVVAPALLLAPEGLGVAVGDEDLRTTRLTEPGWWHFEFPVAAPGEQTDLPFEPAAQPIVAAQPKLPQIVERLATSAIFKAHAKTFPPDRIKEDLERLSMLVIAGGSLAEAELARRCGVQAYRVGGLVARLAELCNLDGYAVITHDLQGRQVVLDLSLLRQLFEVKA